MECRVWLGHCWGLSLHEDEIITVLLALGQREKPQSNPSTLWVWWGELAVSSFLVVGGETPATITATQPRLDTLLPVAGPCDQSQRAPLCTGASASPPRSASSLLQCSPGSFFCPVWEVERRLGRGREGGQTHSFTWCAFHDAESIPPVVFWLRCRCESRPTAEQQM